MGRFEPELQSILTKSKLAMEQLDLMKTLPTKQLEFKNEMLRSVSAIKNMLTQEDSGDVILEWLNLY